MTSMGRKLVYGNPPVTIGSLEFDRVERMIERRPFRRGKPSRRSQSVVVFGCPVRDLELPNLMMIGLIDVTTYPQ